MSVNGRRLAAACAFLALTAVLAACGSVSGTIDPVASAATKSVNAGTAHMTFSLTISSPLLGGGKKLTMSGDGHVSANGSDLTLDMGQLLAQAGAPAGSDGTMREIFVHESGDAVVYLRLGLLDPYLGGRHWVRLDLSQAGKKLGIDVGKLMAGQTGTDPGQWLGMLKATSGSVQDLGAETIDGVETTHYRATVDLQKAAQVKGVSIDQLLKLAGQGMPLSVPEDVWVDSSGLVRQLRVSYGLTTNGTPMRMSMTLGLSDYGMQTTITAPPASDVVDASRLALGSGAQTPAP